MTDEAIRPAASTGPAQADPGRTGAVLRARLLLLATLLVVGSCVYALSRLLADVSYADLVDAVEATSYLDFGLALIFTALSFAALTAYDHQALAFVGRRLPLPGVALTSFCAYAVGNVAGFGPLTGGAIRYRFYTRLGVPPEDIAGIVGYVTGAFGLGLLFATALGIVWSDHGVANLVGWPPIVLRTAAIVVLAGIGALILTAAVVPRTARIFGRIVVLPRSGVILLQLLATMVDLAAAGAVLYVLLPPGAISYPVFLAIYAVAIGLGVLSHVPGGIGVFETVILGTVGRELPLDGVVAALVLYRFVYYVVPLCVAVGAVTITELRRTALGNPIVGRAAGALLPIMASALAVLLGAMLVFSGVTPSPDARLDWLQDTLPPALVEGAHFASSVLGVLLIVAARGLSHRLDGAWWLAAILAGVSIPLALLKALAFGEAILLSAFLAMLLLTHRAFDRPASLVHDRLTVGWWICVGTVIAVAIAMLFFAYKEVDYSRALWWQFEIQAEAPRSLRAAVGVCLAAAGLAIWRLTRPPAGRSVPVTPQEIERALAIARTQSNPDANLVRMGDKSVLFSDNGRAFLMYGKRGRSWIALFDPLGDLRSGAELVWRFVEMARRHGGRAVFYQVSASTLSLYADAGLSAFKLGEEAKIRLAHFDTKGARRGSIRTAINKLERDGVSFAVLPPSEVGGVLDELEAISVLWLSEHRVREKSFSLGTFERGYLIEQPVAVLRQAGRVIAFASLMLTDTREEATVDLMRFDPVAPNGSMEVLFAKLLLHFKAEGYAWFSLGMAPLAGMSENPVAPLWHRVGRAAFDHGEALYNFRGLRAFKNKFDPEWHSRYMAVSGGLNPVLALADVTVLISGGLRGAVSQ